MARSCCIARFFLALAPVWAVWGCGASQARVGECEVTVRTCTLVPCEGMALGEIYSDDAVIKPIFRAADAVRAALARMPPEPGAAGRCLDRIEHHLGVLDQIHLEMAAVGNHPREWAHTLLWVCTGPRLTAWVRSRAALFTALDRAATALCVDDKTFERATAEVSAMLRAFRGTLSWDQEPRKYACGPQIPAALGRLCTVRVTRVPVLPATEVSATTH